MRNSLGYHDKPARGCIRVSYVKSRFPGLFPKIEASRASNPALAEVCQDLEALAQLYEDAKDTMVPAAKQNMMDSIRGLENEISAAFELRDD